MAEGGLQLAEEEAKTKSNSHPQMLDTPEGRRLAYHRTPGSQHLYHQYITPTSGPGTSPGVVYIHGLNSNMNGEKAMALEGHCVRHGMAFVRFDLSGHGSSSQEFKDCDISMWLEDLNSVMSSLTEGLQVLVGSSLGGWLMFLYAMRNPDRMHGLVGVSIAPDFTQSIWKGLDKETKKEVRRSGVYHLKSEYSSEPYDISLELIQDGDKYSILEMPGESQCTTIFESQLFNDLIGIEYITCPVKLFHGEKDTCVPVNTVLKLLQRLDNSLGITVGISLVFVGTVSVLWLLSP